MKVGVANFNCNFVGTQVHSLVASDDTGSVKAWATEAMIVWQLQLSQALVNGTEGTLSAKELDYMQREYHVAATMRELARNHVSQILPISIHLHMSL